MNTVNNENALSHNPTITSKEKLISEGTAPDPDLRRCVAHFRQHYVSFLWTEIASKLAPALFKFGAQFFNPIMTLAPPFSRMTHVQYDMKTKIKDRLKTLLYYRFLLYML